MNPRRNPEVTIIIFIIWMLSLLCISSPGRVAPTDVSALDPIAFLKLASRLFSTGALVLILLRHHSDPLIYPMLLRTGPLTVFVLWTIVSALWSPMKAVSLGHSFDLFLLLLLTICSGLVFTDDEQRRRAFRATVFPSALLSGVLVMLDPASIASGARPVSYLHPNELGSLAGVGLVTLLLARYLWDWRWSRVWFLPCAAAMVAALYSARSRTSWIATLVIAAMILWKFRRPHLFTGLLLGLGVLLALGPYVREFGSLPEELESYALRGGSTESVVMTGSGRDELWAIAIEEFKTSPLFGHGYFVISSTGLLNVWGKTQWLTAHNLILHVLTGTGILGLLLFCAGFVSLCYAPCMRWMRWGPRAARSEYAALLCLAWSLIVGLFEVSFLGPIDPINVSLFCLLGMAGSPVLDMHPLPERQPFIRKPPALSTAGGAACEY
jgi:O-antigen ligase